MNILITGVHGMVGSSLKNLLQTTNFTIYCPSKASFDLRYDHNVKQMYEVYHPDYVVNCAAVVGGVKFNRECPDVLFRDNLLINTHMIHYAHVYRVKKFIGFSSACAFQDNVFPFQEEKLQDGRPYEGNLAYGYAKRMVDIQIGIYNKLYNRKDLTIIPTSLYGPCFSADTEILTPKGIKKITDIKKGDEVFTLNSETHKVEITKVINTNTNPTKELYLFQGKGVDFNITPDHIMYVKVGNGKFKKIRADWFKEKVGKKYGQLQFAIHEPIINKESTNEFSLKKHIDSKHLYYPEENCVKDFNHSHSKKIKITYNINDVVELLGWYISEGSIYNNNGSTTIKISQNKTVNYNHYQSIRQLLERMNITYCEQEKCITFTSRLWSNFLTAEAGTGSENKKIPSFIYELSYSIQCILFKTLMFGDGNKSEKRYTTKSEKLMIDFIMLAFYLSVKIGHIYKDNKECWRISIRNKRKSPVVKYKNISISPTNELVHCITTEKNNIIYAGRNKKFNWIGQCDNFCLENGHFVSSLIKKTYIAQQTGTPLRIWGDGSPLRELLFVDDLSTIIYNLLWMETPDKLIIPGEEISIKDVALTIIDLMKFRGEVIWETDKPNGQYRKPTDPTRFQQIMGVYPFTPYREGLKQTIDWFLKQKETSYPVRGD